MRVNADSLLIRAAATLTSGTLNDLAADLIVANNNNNNSSVLVFSAESITLTERVYQCKNNHAYFTGSS